MKNNIHHISRLIFCIIAATIMVGCKHTEYVTVEKTKTDTLYNNKVIHDITIINDSTYIYIKGDTVFRDRTQKIHVYHFDTDTLYKSNYIKVPEPYPVMQNVNILTWWQKLLMFIGAVTILFFIIKIFHSRMIN